MHYIPVFSTIITFSFAASVVNRYKHRKGKHLLIWSIGFLQATASHPVEQSSRPVAANS